MLPSEPNVKILEHSFLNTPVLQLGESAVGVLQRFIFMCAYMTLLFTTSSSFEIILGMTSSSSEENKVSEAQAKLEFLPDAQEEKTEASFIRKLDIPFDPDCVVCKFVTASVCYGSSVLVLSAIKNIPKENMPGRIMTGLFGVGLLGLGTLRLYVKGRNPPDLFFK